MCQSCGFWYQDQIVECHHLVPLHIRRVSVVSVETLITLCPTCHRIAHSLLRQDLDKRSNQTTLLAALKFAEAA
ncbi:MAG: HNH endonuclease [Kordiimonadaceae bacterium]|nr:HNH endonuclease [Kordiimonadaceae bacterium]